MAADPSHELRSRFGEIDIYLFDQLLKGRFDHRRRILDAGCGGGRNLVFFLQRGYDVLGVDRDPEAIQRARALAHRLAPALPADRFRVAEVESLPFPDASVDAVLCSAVLHFANDHDHLDRMIRELWRVLAPGGLFFARLASSIGLEGRLEATSGRVTLPDGTERFLVDEAMLLEWTRRLGATLREPIKTTNVQNLRCMTTWCLEKPISGGAGSGIPS